MIKAIFKHPLTLIILIALLAACDNTPVNNEDDNGVQTVTERSTAPADAYPVAGTPSSAYPAPGEGLSSNVVNRPETLPTFPGAVAFASDRLGRFEIFILDGATGILSKLSAAVPTYEPAWSPDCSTIWMTGETGLNIFQLYKADAAADSQAEPAGNATFSYGPAISPDGTIVAFQQKNDLQINVCFADAATGEQLSCLPAGNYSNAMPSWSPAGNQLVFGSNRTGDFELFIMSYPDNGTYLQLTENPGNDYDAEFSPDGSKIAFSSIRDGNYDIYSIAPDGTNLVRVTNSISEEKAPTWVGNDQIVLVSDLTTNDELYLVPASGGTMEQLTYNFGVDSDPNWCATNR